MPEPLKALEFYCGIGGLHFALSSVVPHAVVVDAFDVSPTANAVYAHNFGTPVNKLDLECITAHQLDAYAADLWLLSPPCQPHTRQGMKKGSADARSRSLHNLLEALKQMQHPPKWLLLENVVGFEHSDTHSLLAQVFVDAGYSMQEFILSPLQYGIPYTRPRYFCLASKQPFPVALAPEVQPCQCTPALLLQLKERKADAQTISAAAQQHLASHIEYIQSVGEYLWKAAPIEQQQQQQQQGPQQQQQWVPDTLLQKHAGVVRVVTAASRNCNCFTKSYSQFARGTGSLLATIDPVGIDPRWRLVGEKGALVFTSPSSSSNAQTCTCMCSARTSSNGDGDGAACDSSNSCCHTQQQQQQQHAEACSHSSSSSGAAPVTVVRPGEVFIAVQDRQDTSDEVLGELGLAWRDLKVRYFTPLEIARFHSFPSSFSFPPDMTARQCYQLLGNSLSVAVVADLLSYLLTCG